MESMDLYFDEIKKYAPLTKSEERVYFAKAKAGDITAYNTIIYSNLRFVISIAKKYQGQGLTLEDLIAEGNSGLVRAYKKFDTSKNFKFITYAVWWIKQSILTAIHEHSRIIRIPANKISSVTKVGKIKSAIEQESQRIATLNEIADRVDDPSMLDDLQYNYSVVDLDQPMTDNDKDMNSILEDQSYNIETSVESINDELNDLLKNFPEREKIILRMYFGIGYERSYTLKEIGAEVGLTRERVRQLKENTLSKLRKKKRAERLRGYLD